MYENEGFERAVVDASTHRPESKNEHASVIEFENDNFFDEQLDHQDGKWDR